MIRPPFPSDADAPLSSHAAVPATVATALLVAMPPVMWAANRSAPLLLVLTALAVLWADAASGRLSTALPRLRAALAGPVTLTLAAFLVWSLVTIAWSHRPGPSLSMYGELLLPLAGACVAALGWPRRAPPWAFRALGLALVLTGALIMVELWVGPALRDRFGLRSQIYIFNRPLLLCLLLSVPAIQKLWTAAPRAGFDRALAALVGLSVAGAVLAGESGAAELGLIVVAATWLAALLLPRLALAGVALAFAATMLIAPILGTLADRAIPPKMHAQLSQSHSRDRVDIWLSFGEAIRARPLLGSGFGASVAMGTHPVAAQVSQPRRMLLDVGHPHSAPVQAWVETGGVGAALLLACGLFFLAGLRRLDAATLAPRLAAFAGAFAVAAVGHGAWQGWWIASLGAVAMWFLAVSHRDTETIP